MQGGVPTTHIQGIETAASVHPDLKRMYPPMGWGLMFKVTPEPAIFFIDSRTVSLGLP